MSKIFSKTVKKTPLWAALIALLAVAAIVVGIVFGGFNKDVSLQDHNTLTVSVNTFLYNTKKEDVREACENKFGDLKANYVVEGTMQGADNELVFVFNDDADLSSVKTALTEYFKEAVKTGGAFEGGEITVSTAKEAAVAVLAKHYVLRGVIAGAILAVLAFAYVAIRQQNWWIGMLVGISTLLGMVTAASLVMLARIPVTAAIGSVIAIGGLLTVVVTMLSFGKINAKKKEEAEISREELVATSVAWKEVAVLAGLLVVGLVLIGIVGKTAAIWFALSALCAVVGSVFVGLAFAPAAYLTAQKIVDKRPVREGYVGAKKTSNRIKKLFTKKTVEEAPVEETEEAPAVEAAEEAEETSVEEAPVEEAPVEETEEAPVDETPAEEEKTEE